MKQSIIVIIIAVFLSSCKREETSLIQSINVQEKVTDYYPLDNGNYWIYQQYVADTSLIFSTDNQFDSVFVEKDSLLHGFNYKKLKSSMWGITLVRDSADYIVNQLGQKIFTIKQTSDFLINQYEVSTDSLLYTTSVMKQSDSVCIVPAGQFQSKYVIGTVTATKPVPTWMEKRNYYFAFVKGIGIVLKRNMYVTGPNYIEQRLLRYHINTK